MIMPVILMMMVTMNIFFRDSRKYHYDGTTPVTTFILLYCNHH